MNTDFLGVSFDLPAEQYHALPGASPSKLKHFHGATPAEARVKLEEPFEPSVFMKLGTLAHHKLLEPHKPFPSLEVWPDVYPDEKGKLKPWHMGANYCTDWVEKREKSGIMTLPRQATKTRPGFEDLNGIINALLSKRTVEKLLEGARTEVSVGDWSELHSMPVRCRIDIVPRIRSLADVKVTTQQDDFESHAYRMGYHIQAAMNLELWNSQAGEEDPKDDFRFITVMPTRPYCVKVFKCSEEFLQRGREDWHRLLGVYAQCLHSGVWPDYPDREFPLTLPKWAKAII